MHFIGEHMYDWILLLEIQLLNSTDMFMLIWHGSYWNTAIKLYCYLNVALMWGFWHAGYGYRTINYYYIAINYFYTAISYCYTTIKLHGSTAIQLLNCTVIWMLLWCGGIWHGGYCYSAINYCYIAINYCYTASTYYYTAIKFYGIYCYAIIKLYCYLNVSLMWRPLT